MPRRAPQTLADYMVVGISPALVMFMVGSLLWFLTIVFYQGDYGWRLLFVHAMFIMGVVGITRISMEEGAAYAAMFAAPLALAVAVAYVSFVKVEGALAPISPLINLALEAVIWFSAHKLTWDCTLIDDSQDSSKQGLLQAMGWDRVEGEFAASEMTNDEARMTNGETKGPSADQQDLDATTSREVQVFHWIQSFFVPDKRPHTPGVWIIYFSLAALPLFGIGQWFIPAEHVELRRNAFWLLVVYVTCGLGLLLNTSFLGLRRYLRQRNLLMPTEMAATWLGVGVTMILVVLAVVWLLPRPGAEHSVAQLDMFKSKPLDPSRWGWGKDGSKKSGKSSQTKASGQGGQKSDKAQSSKNGDSKSQSSGKGKGAKDGGGKGDAGKSSSQDKSQGGKSSGGKGTGKDKSEGGAKNKESGSDSQKGDKSGSKDGSKQQPFDKNDSQSESSSKQKSDRKPSPQKNQSTQNASQGSSATQSEDSSSDDSQEDQSQSSSSSSTPERNLELPRWMSALSPTVGQILKWLFYLLVIGTIVVLAWIYRAQLIAAWKKLLAELRELWARWFGGSPAPAATAVVPVAAPPRPFATYADPFASGMAGQAPLVELVRYTFEALEAWGREHDAPRGTGQTAHEYALQVGQVHEPLAGEVRFLAELYGQLAYAQRSARQANVEPLKNLWRQMRVASGGV